VTRFFDTNILVYAYTNDPRKTVSRRLMSEVPAIGGCISVQILNELTNVFMRKLKMPWHDIERAIVGVRHIFGSISPITEATHASAFGLCRDHSLSIYDALIVSSALETGCTQLLSEDMQPGCKFGNLTIVNPFLEL
jgi:predicted nucleic acid-binding protein